MKGPLTVVTGAGGFIGGHMVAALRREGLSNIRAVDIKPLAGWYQAFPEVECVELDLSRRESCFEALQGADIVYHFAADMGGMGFIEGNKALCMLSVLIDTHILLAARDRGVHRLFYASSACIYPVDKQTSTDVQPLKESDAYPAMAEDGYGWEKLFAERMCRHFQEDFGLQTRLARYHNVYGPFGPYTGGREKAPAAICRKVARAKLHGERDIEIWGDGNQTRSFMYIDDCIHGTSLIMQSDIAEPINLGTAELVSINHLVDLVETVAGVRLRRKYNLSAPQGVRGRNSDNSRIASEFGWQPSFPLAMGIEQTYRWIYDREVKGEI